jgi:N-acyl homoserine lactone hydrolase
MPVYVHVIDHPDARVLVDTGMTELHPAVADLDPRLRPLSKQDFDLAGIDIVVNTHLHFDHCGGNHLFAGRPIYVQRRELDDARSEDDYTIREWVEAPGVRYVPVDGELELLPGLRLVPAPGHTRGMQVVVVETGGRPVVVGGDVAVWFGELDEPHTEGQLRVRALDPELVWLAHDARAVATSVERHHPNAEPDAQSKEDMTNQAADEQARACRTVRAEETVSHRGKHQQPREHVRADAERPAPVTGLSPASRFDSPSEQRARSGTCRSHSAPELRSRARYLSRPRARCPQCNG